MTCEPPTNSHRDTRRYPRIALTPRRLTQNWVRFGISPTPARPGNPRLPRGVYFFMLEALNLTKTFLGPPAVDCVSFTIRPGEILGYLGPNGAGKSTTVKMLTGLLEPTSGRVLFHGQDIRRDLKVVRPIVCEVVRGGINGAYILNVGDARTRVGKYLVVGV